MEKIPNSSSYKITQKYIFVWAKNHRVGPYQTGKLDLTTTLLTSQINKC